MLLKKSLHKMITEGNYCLLFTEEY